MAADLLTPPAPAPVLGLDALELEAAVHALVDRDEVAGPRERARLRRARAVLEAELGRLVAGDA